MKIRNKNVVLVSVLLLVVLAAGYLNFALANNKSEASEANAQAAQEQAAEESLEAASADYFDQYRQEREEARDKEIGYIDAIVVSAEVDSETKKEAQEQKLSIVTCMEQEQQCEGVIKTKLNLDAIVTVQDGSVNVVVKKSELDDQEVTQIVDIVKTQTGQDAQNIKIMPQA